MEYVDIDINLLQLLELPGEWLDASGQTACDVRHVQSDQLRWRYTVAATAQSCGHILQTFT